MFTGIVRERGTVVATNATEAGRRLVVEAPTTASETVVGDSVSVDGVCLTATDVADGRVTFDAVPETLSRTTLGRLDAGDEINVEPALRAGEPLGGHYVQGHVDGVGRVRALDREGESLRVVIEASADLLRYCVEKGSVAVQGVSLTIAELRDDAFVVALVPHTLEVTTFGTVALGDELNIEVDVLAKYVERLVSR
jgi:riboflavin synthase alpha subunit